MGNFQTLIAEYDLLDRLASELIELIEDPVMDIVAVLSARANLAIALDERLSREDCNADIASAWHHYLAMWKPLAICTDWAGFGAETRVMLTRLHRSFTNDNALLHAIALHAGAARLRAAA